MEMLLQFLLLVIGFVMLVKGADWFVDGAAGIAGKFGIPQLVIGLTIVACGTSAPEAAVSIGAVLKGSAGITIGNVVGSNILNILIILGITSVITTLKVSRSTINCEIPFMIFVTVLLLVFGFTGGQINFMEGCLLWLAFIVYLVYLFHMAKNNREEGEEEQAQASAVKLLIFLIAGLIIVVWGSDVTVNAATAIAREMGMSERFIGLTIVALGTSLPELVTSVTAAMKKQADIAIGNIVGSNIFNILFVVGTTALIRSVTFEQMFLIDTVIALAAGVILWLCVWKKKMLTRPAGILMLAAYALYFLYLVFQPILF